MNGGNTEGRQFLVRKTEHVAGLGVDVKDLISLWIDEDYGVVGVVKNLTEFFFAFP